MTFIPPLYNLVLQLHEGDTRFIIYWVFGTCDFSYRSRQSVYPEDKRVNGKWLALDVFMYLIHDADESCTEQAPPHVLYLVNDGLSLLDLAEQPTDVVSLVDLLLVCRSVAVKPAA